MDIITEFEYLERMLGEVLDVVPYESHGKMPPSSVWSGRLSTLLQETCSQLDSYCRHHLGEARQKPSRGTDFTMADYRSYLGPWLAPRKLVFWQDDRGAPVGLQPWKDADLPDKPMSWWKAYNAVKHDRLTNKTSATLKVTVEALAALFLLIVRLAGIDDRVKRMFIASKWWDGTGHMASIEESGDQAVWQNLRHYNIIESRLFSFPLGWWSDKAGKAYYLDFDTRLVEDWSMLDQRMAMFRLQESYWGGQKGMNNPPLVGGSQRWKFFFNSWVHSMPRPVTETSSIRPLIHVDDGTTEYII